MTVATNGTVVREVISSTASGEQVMSALPGLVRRLLDEQAWREFPAPGLAEVVRHERFAEFITDSPPRGLGGRDSQLIALCGMDKQLADEVRGLLYAEIPPAASHGELGRGRLRDKPIISKPGPTAERTVARLKRDDPALADRVVRGEISPNAAAQEKGWRKPRILLTSPERVAEAIRRYMPAESITRLARLLMAADEGEPHEPGGDRPDDPHAPAT